MTSDESETAAISLPANMMGVPAQTAFFFVMVCILLLPAWLNGFPFVMSDSIAYSGQGVNWMRSKTAAVAMAPLYGLLGYWALPLANAILTAAAWLVLAHLFGIGRAIFVAIPLAVLALQPLYASAVIVDIWFFCAVIAGIAAMRWSSPFLALVTGILLSAHGSGVLLFAPLVLAAAIAFRAPRFLAYGALAIVTAFVVTAALDMRHYADKPRLEKTFLASRIFSAYPDLLRNECSKSGAEILCRAAARVEQLRAVPEYADRRDFFWELTRELQPGFDLSAFEKDHALPIILDAVTNRPFDILALAASDFASFYAPATTLDFLERPDQAMPHGFSASRQAAGAMQSPAVEQAVSTARYLLYAVAAIMLVYGWRRAGPDARRWVVLLLLLALANDALFAILSGPPDRYHHRILGLLAAAAILAIGASARSEPSSSD